jgi:hypothetical protein
VNTISKVAMAVAMIVVGGAASAQSYTYSVNFSVGGDAVAGTITTDALGMITAPEITGAALNDTGGGIWNAA